MVAPRYDYKFQWKAWDEQPIIYINDFDKNHEMDYNLYDMLNDSVDVNYMNVQILNQINRRANRQPSEVEFMIFP